MKFFLSSKSAY